MTQGLFTLEEVPSMIRAGDKILLTGDGNLLLRLPIRDFIFYPRQSAESFMKIFIFLLPNFVETVVRNYHKQNNFKYLSGASLPVKKLNLSI